MTEQLDFPFFLDEKHFTAFLTQWIAIEQEEERLRNEKRQLKELHQDHFPLRGTLVAIKRVRAQRKLEEHPTEPMKREHLTYLEKLVETYLDMQDLTREVEASGVTITARVPDMTRPPGE
jgi:hypothetical protein